MRIPPAVLIVMLLFACASAPCRAQSATQPILSAPQPLGSLAKALAGKWHLDVRFESAAAGGNKPVEGPGEESWSLGPGGITLIEQEHIPSPNGDTFLMGLIWWDGTRKQLRGMECNSYLPTTCDLKGALNDIALAWDGSKFEIDEIETHDGRRTIWHEYWSDITPDSFLQTGDVTQPDGTTTRFMTIRGRRVRELKTIRGDAGELHGTP